MIKHTINDGPENTRPVRGNIMISLSNISARNAPSGARFETRRDVAQSTIVIAVTREIGSLGTEVAAGIAEKLGLKNVHSEIVADTIARRLGVAEELVRRHVDGSASLLDRWQVNRRRLSRYSCEEIISLAHKGNVLIQGWGAATLLRDMPQVISVRVCAPMDFRVRVMMERLGNKNATAVREEIKKFDATRARAMRGLFNLEEEDSRLYHLVLNTERLPLNACVKAVCELAEGPHFEDRVSMRSMLADKLLEAKIRSALTEKISVTMAPLGVSVSVLEGKITLAGTTTSGSLRSEAERIAYAVAGRANIENRIISVPSRGRAH
jgi:cytidylate kinase